jgi:hypothetical protein
MAWKIIVCAAVVLLLVLGVRAFQNKAASQQSSQVFVPVPADKAMSTYLGFRNQALTASATGQQQSDAPCAVLMDMPVTSGTATIAAFADGTASIYISKGGGYLGGSQTYPAIREAGLRFIATARKFQAQMRVTQQFPLPEHGEVIFYVATGRGVYTVKAPQAELNKRSHPLTELYAAAQDVITQYRLNFKK